MWAKTTVFMDSQPPTDKMPDTSITSQLNQPSDSAKIFHNKQLTKHNRVNQSIVPSNYQCFRN